MAKHVKRPQRLLLAVAVVASGAAFGVLASSRAAQADAPALQGWWTVTNNPSLPVKPSDPLVPATGLLVQGGASTPSAYAALSYAIAAGVTAGKLTLAVAPNSGSTPGASLQLCPLTTPSFSPEQGGAMENAPTYDCNTKVAAEPNDAGTAYTFTVSSLVSGEVLAVAIVPVDPTTRVVLSQPADSSLTTQQTAPPATSFGAPPPPAAQPAPAPAPAAGTGTAQ